MAKPTVRSPTWATDGGADVTDPGSSKQATGWVEGEAPAADHTNWLHRTRGEWLEWASSLSRPLPNRLQDSVYTERTANVQSVLTGSANIGIDFSPDGSVFFIQNLTSVYQFSCVDSDLDTLTDASKSLSTSAVTDPTDLVLNADGTKLWIVDSTDDDILTYELPAPYDLSGASLDSETFDFSSQIAGAEKCVSIHFSSDFSKMFLGMDDEDIFQYTLSTPGDVSSAGYDSKTYAFAQGSGLVSARVSGDGKKLFVLDSGNDTIYQHTLSTPNDIGSVSYDSVSLATTSETSTPQRMAIGREGGRIYISDGSDDIWQYSLGRTIPGWP